MPFARRPSGVCDEVREDVLIYMYEIFQPHRKMQYINIYVTWLLMRYPFF